MSFVIDHSYCSWPLSFASFYFVFTTLGAIYEFVCVSFRTDNLNYFKYGKMTVTNKVVYVPKAKPRTNGHTQILQFSQLAEMIVLFVIIPLRDHH